ncbi:MAG: tetratricopeptide repeat protein [Planctomycetota bacterium]|nr:tetratricopeptide repeat protein [Planctomycetota bacterium]
MKKWMLAAGLLAVLVGCNMSSVPEARDEAYKRWDHTRAKMLYGVAEEQLKVGQLDQARNKAQEALSLDADYIEARTLLAKVYIEQGHYIMAIAELRKVIENKADLAEAWYLLGVAQEKEGRLTEALASYRRAHALDDSHLAAVIAAAEVMVAMGRIKDAQFYLEGYTHLAGDEVGMYELAARLAMIRRQYDKAAKYYQQALDVDYKNLRYRERMGRAQYFAGQHAQARETFVALLASKQYAAPAWMYTMLGDCYMVENRPFEAQRVYRQASQRSPSAPGVWVNLAKVALSINQPTQAVIAADQALQRDENCLDATLVLGYALLRQMQVSRAIGVLTQATAVHPASGMLQCVLGQAHAAAGDYALAVQCYAKAAKLEPKSTLARELLAGADVKELSKID